ncbi:MAG: protease complex subunit PrcB family protein [Candidatus Goldbacteria bacterium]|nr:protease complex subunit PrcB family protein [Candidatus Goldiibacteriota bacterium]
MEHKKAYGLISDYIDGTLKGEQLKNFLAHLKTCKECRNQLDALKNAVQYAKSGRAEDLPVNFLATLSKRLDEADSKKAKTKFSWPVFMKVSGTVAAMLIVGVLVRQIYDTKTIKADKEWLEAESVQKPVVVERAKTAEELKSVKQGINMADLAPLKSEAPAEITYAKKKSAAPSRAIITKSEAAPAAGMASKSAAAPAYDTADEIAPASAVQLQEQEINPFSKEVFSGTHSGMAAGMKVVFKNKMIWNLAPGIIADNPWLGKVDFSRQMVVLVNSGEKPTAGYSAKIKSISIQETKIVILYSETSPAKDAITAQVITSPYSIAVIPISSKPVEFIRE